MLTINLPENVEKRLNDLASAVGSTASQYARAALLEHLDEMDDVREALVRLEDNRAGRSHTLSLAEVERLLELDDTF